MILLLPVPPSANHLFATGRRNGKFCRFRTKQYLAWQKEAGLILQTYRKTRFTGRFPGEVEVEITLPCGIRGDIDNRVKPILDLLVKHGVIRDDRYVKQVHISRTGSSSMAGVCVVPA